MLGLLRELASWWLHTRHHLLLPRLRVRARASFRGDKNTQHEKLDTKQNKLMWVCRILLCKEYCRL